MKALVVEQSAVNNRGQLLNSAIRVVYRKSKSSDENVFSFFGEISLPKDKSKLKINGTTIDLSQQNYDQIQGVLIKIFAINDAEIS